MIGDWIFNRRRIAPVGMKKAHARAASTAWEIMTVLTVEVGANRLPPSDPGPNEEPPLSEFPPLELPPLPPKPPGY